MPAINGGETRGFPVAQDLFSTMIILAPLPGKNSRSALRQLSRRALRRVVMVPEKISESPLETPSPRRQRAGGKAPCWSFPAEAGIQESHWIPGQARNDDCAAQRRGAGAKMSGARKDNTFARDPKENETIRKDVTI